MEFHRILVGLELGKLSDAAVVRAMSLAREFRAHLDVVHGAGVHAPHLGAARRAFHTAHAERVLARARDAAAGRLEQMVEDPAYAGRPLEEYLHVLPEHGAQALLTFAREHGADLIVLGAHRHRRPIDLGGTARAILARSPCPVWVEPVEARRFERVLAAVDLSPSTALVLRAARGLAARFSVPVRVLHVFTPPVFAYDPEGPGPTYVVDDLRKAEHDDLRERVSAFDWGELPVEADFAEGDPVETVVAHAQPADLVVMGTHGHTRFARAVLGSCAHGVLKHGRGPMLVLPEHEEHYPDAA